MGGQVSGATLDFTTLAVVLVLTLSPFARSCLSPCLPRKDTDMRR